MRKTLLVVLAMALVPFCAFAVDGVTLINQSTVMAAGGFPYTITQPGSYRLSGNLSVPASTTGIQISQSNVTIDLNGFTITTTAVAPSGQFIAGITSFLSTVTGITIRNGAIRGFTTPVEPYYPNQKFWTLEDLFLEWGFGGQTSIDLGAFTRISHVTAPDTTINVQCPSLVADSVVRAISPNGGSGTCAFANNATF